MAAEQAEAERLEQERVEAERAEAERVEAERIAAERAEAERIEADRIAAERAEAERLAAERAEADRLEAERITAATTLDERDRAWLQDRLAQLEQRYQHLPPGLPRCAIHGDPWAGNVAVTVTGPVILDLERFAIGPSEWDLASVAVNYTTFGNVSADE